MSQSGIISSRTILAIDQTPALSVIWFSMYLRLAREHYMNALLPTSPLLKNFPHLLVTVVLPYSG